jgi:putative phosphoribosyl transferase
MNSTVAELAVKIPPIGLIGDLAIPAQAAGAVVFAHGSGSSRHSPRNRYVASVLQEAGFATLLLDLLTAAEESLDLVTGDLRFDIPLLSDRLVQATDWLARSEEACGLSIGYFGASTGAAAALVAAARRPAIAAVVSRGGRPDLAGSALLEVRAPTLLIVGGNDDVVIRLNEEALALLRSEKELAIVPGATHLFEERGALEQVAAMAARWFERYLK